MSKKPNALWQKSQKKTHKIRSKEEPLPAPNASQDYLHLCNLILCVLFQFRDRQNKLSEKTTKRDRCPTRRPAKNRKVMVNPNSAKQKQVTPSAYTLLNYILHYSIELDFKKKIQRLCRIYSRKATSLIWSERAQKALQKILVIIDIWLRREAFATAVKTTCR